MKIACIGWGSLVWDPRDLPIRGTWFTDGPILPIEFARQSKDGRITLVIEKKSKYVRTLWALMYVDDPNTARKQLGHREGLKKDECIENNIGLWEKKKKVSDDIEQIIAQWGKLMGLDAAVWASLPPKFKGEYRVPKIEELITYLNNELSHEKRRVAEHYIRRTPRQIDTDYRRRIEAELKWKPIVEGFTIRGIDQF
jgi:hypothetical protein